MWKSEYKGRNVAVKVLRMYSTSDLAKIRRVGPHILSQVSVGRLILGMQGFCREVVTWAALRHPNVLSLLGIVMDNDQLAMMSEWMTNGNIREFVGTHREANRFELVRSRPNC